MKAIITIHPSGRTEMRLAKKTPNYRDLQRAVGGSIETVPHLHRLTHDGRRYTRGTAYVSETGKLNGLPLNRLATAVWLENLGAGPFWYEPKLHGTVVFVASATERSEA